MSTLSTPTAQVCHPVKTRTKQKKKQKNKNKNGAMCATKDATKFLNPLKYKTPDILKMLAAKMTLLQF